ncbi:diguanylate cyclase [Pseudomonas sp. DWP3-1-2]|uniref:diguanylate cyclase n=1 Tax=Pseudomonas sp. DWP3-1-2 TaxID=2804645 RepID=UPI003CE89F3A
MKNYEGKGLSFAKRIYWSRSAGVSIGCISVAASLYPLNPPAWIWALMVCNVLIWPQVALRLAQRSTQPYQAERRNILCDSVAGGFWAASMGFSPLPTVTVLAMMGMHNIAAGGQRLFLLGCIAQAVGALIATLLFSPSFVPESTTLQLYACLPVLVIYPLVVGHASYQLAVKLSEHKHILSKLSRTDSLTGLINHGSWKDLLQLEFGNCQTLSRQTTVALIDIDHFKSINDTHGHIAGDAVLKQMSAALVANLREADLAGRYGGDEFCVILPNTSLDLALEILERLNHEVSNYHDATLPDLKISLSIGVATYHPCLSDAAAWLNEADKALYMAKSTGRNRICAAQPTPAANDGPLDMEVSAS